jgi:hypothetical protein
MGKKRRVKERDGQRRDDENKENRMKHRRRANVAGFCFQN